MEKSFQSTPPRGRRQYECIIKQVVVQISIHSAARAETGRHRQNWQSTSRFQSTPPRGRRPGNIHDFLAQMVISIHSAARAETEKQAAKEFEKRLFQSTPPRGRRRPLHKKMPRWSEFQSTPPRGRRRTCIVPDEITVYISIHSAARAETNLPEQLRVVTTYFNPLRREGGDLIIPCTFCF